MSTLRFGLIGAGNIALHSAKAILTHPQARLVAAHDPHAQRLAELAAAFEIPHTFADVNDLLACDEVDRPWVCNASSTAFMNQRVPATRRRSAEQPDSEHV